MITDVLLSMNFLLVVLGTGALVWFIRQILPEGSESKRFTKVSLRAGPAIIGGLLSCIPQLMPISDNLIQSIVVGFIGGTFSQATYSIVRSIVPDKIRQLMGGKEKV